MGYQCSRFFYSIDGNVIKASQAVGYCRYKQGMVSKSQCECHKCLDKVNGEMCNKFIKFEYEDRYCSETKSPTGEAYQEYLKRKR